MRFLVAGIDARKIPDTADGHGFVVFNVENDGEDGMMLTDSPVITRTRTGASSMAISADSSALILAGGDPYQHARRWNFELKDFVGDMEREQGYGSLLFANPGHDRILVLGQHNRLQAILVFSYF